MLLTVLGKHVIFCRNDSTRKLKASGVLLLDTSASLFPDYLYVAEPRDVIAVLQRPMLSDNLVIFTAGDAPRLRELAEKCSTTVCITDLSLIALHNELFRCLEIYKEWRDALVSKSDGGIYSILQTGGALADASIYLLNLQQEIVAGSTKPEYGDLLRYVIDYNQTIISEDVKKLFTLLNEKEPFANTKGEEGINLCVLPIQDGTDTLGYLFTASKYELSLLKQLLFLIAIEVAESLSKSDSLKRGRISFQTLAQDLFSKDQPEHLEALQMRIQRLPHPPKKYMRCIVVKPHSSFLYNMNKIAIEFESIFPSDNVGVLGDELVILLSSDYSTCPLACELAELDDLLKKYEAYAMISNPSKTARGIRIMYLQCKGVFDVALKVRYQINNRYFFFERFMPYYIVHLCAHQSKEAFGTDDIVFLSHPGVLAVTRYDRTNNGDLRDVLFTYLLNRCSISRTAQALYMHRNTIIYKINKIEEILGQSMDDPYVRHSLIFSCMLIRYRENYQNEHVQLGVFERTAP